MNAADGRPILALAGQWSHEFVHVMEAMADLRPEMEPDAGAAANDGPWLWWKQSLDAVPGAVAWVGTSEKTWLFLGQQILAAAGIESGSQDEIRSSYLEVLRQSLSAFASAIGSQLEREVTCTEGSEETPPASQTASCRLSIRARAEALPELAFAASPSLLDAMTKPAAEPAPAPPAAAAEAQEAADASARVFNTLDLLLDVEMPVSVSFGRTQVRIQDILKLITGSIIELDRTISEPVEVIVNNCVIARGEVVVVEGNYGVRINEVMSRQQRLQESRRYLLPVSHR